MNSTFKSQSAEPNVRLRCAVYLRSASTMQRSASIEDQLQTCREFADSKGWQILPGHIYKDEGMSGTNTRNRVGLLALQTAAEKRPRPFDCILLEDTARLGRTQADVLNFTKLMAFYGVMIYFVSQRLNSSDENFAVILNTYDLFNQMYVERLREKVFRGQKERVLQGFHVGSVPYGYQTRRVYDTANAGHPVTLGAKLEVAEEQANIVRRIFRQFVGGHRIAAICRQLNAEDIPSPRSIRRAEANAPWSNGAIRRILRSPFVRGEIVWNVSGQSRNGLTGKVEKRIKPVHEHVRVAAEDLRIVDDELWFKAARKLKQFEVEDAMQLVDA